MKVVYKKCFRCPNIKPENINFFKFNKKTNKFCINCITCTLELKGYYKQYHLNNKELKNQQSRDYYIENKDKIKTYIVEWQEENKDKVEIYKEISKNKRNLEENKLLKKEYDKKYRAVRYNDLEYKLRKYTSLSISGMLRINGSSKQHTSCLKYLPFSIQELKTHLESLFEPWMNWGNRGVYRPKKWDDNDSTTWKWQLDHIIPHSDLSYASMEDENFKKC